MDARWIPLLAGALGVLGGVLGAFTGGWIANRGQERTFEREQAAANQEMRREAYGTYLGIAEEVMASVRAAANVDQDELDALLVSLYPAGARIDLIAESDAVTDAADVLAEALVLEPSEEASKTPAEILEEWEQAAKDFGAAARDELEGSGE